MKKRIYKKRIIVILVTLLMSNVISCQYDLDNPVDPEAASYIGTESIDEDGDGLGSYYDVDEISLSSPEDAEKIEIINPTLVITAMDDDRVTTYWIQISTTISFSNIVFEKNSYSSNSCYIPTGYLTDFNTYYWRAKAYDSTTNEWSSSWSETWNFSVTEITITPANGANIYTSTSSQLGRY
ncbi:MAG: hypothetical protein PQJ46_14440 [Spirochaetales bacterium]|nr:hypothetical protein [Spirochaetales bacterium]